jgi:hypothetical protein
MKSVGSVVVAFDGESKCGKTTIINSVAAEARYQAGIIPAILDNSQEVGRYLDEEQKKGLARLQQRLAFNNISTISAGNMFRAAAFYAITQEQRGQTVSGFNEHDVANLRELLTTDGIYDVLQNDPTVGKRVSPVAKMAGAQALCGAIFCDSVVEAYHADGGANLVIIDARDPVGTLRRNNAIGNQDRQIDPASILPIYIETPLEIAAQRMGGNLEDKITEVSSRRLVDATRDELPVVKPNNLVHSLDEWLDQFGEPIPGSAVAAPYCLNNGEGVGLENIQYFAGYIATTAQDVAFALEQNRLSA